MAFQKGKGFLACISSNLDENNRKLSPNRYRIQYKSHNHISNIAAESNDAVCEPVLNHLNKGYKELKSWLGFMEHYRKIIKETGAQLRTCSRKWSKKLRRGTSSFELDPVNRSKMMSIQAFEKYAEILKSQENEVQQVIMDFRSDIDRIYIRKSNKTRIHHQYDTMKEALESRQANIYSLSQELQKLKNQKTFIEEAVEEANQEYKKTKKDTATDSEDLERKLSDMNNKKRNLEIHESEIRRKNKELEKQRSCYQQEIDNIHDKCKVFEKERLDLLGNALARFNVAVCLVKHLNECTRVYDELKQNHEASPDSTDRLFIWEQSYSARHPSKIEDSETSEDDSEEHIGQVYQFNGSAV